MKKEDMSPLRYFTIMQTKTIGQDWQQRSHSWLCHEIWESKHKEQILKLHEAGCEKLIVLPLYPQYAAATTATVCDEVYRVWWKWDGNLVYK